VYLCFYFEKERKKKKKERPLCVFLQKRRREKNSLCRSVGETIPSWNPSSSSPPLQGEGEKREREGERPKGGKGTKKRTYLLGKTSPLFSSSRKGRKGVASLPRNEKKKRERTGSVARAKKVFCGLLYVVHKGKEKKRKKRPAAPPASAERKKKKRGGGGHVHEIFARKPSGRSSLGCHPSRRWEEKKKKDSEKERGGPLFFVPAGQREKEKR